MYPRRDAFKKDLQQCSMVNVEIEMCEIHPKTQCPLCSANNTKEIVCCRYGYSFKPTNQRWQANKEENVEPQVFKYCITESTTHERKDSSQYLKNLNYPKNMTNPKKNMVGQEKYALTLTKYLLRIDSTAKHEKKELTSNIWDLTLKQLRPTRSYE